MKALRTINWFITGEKSKDEWDIKSETYWWWFFLGTEVNI